jgi:hypothetical protein
MIATPVKEHDNYDYSKQAKEHRSIIADKTFRFTATGSERIIVNYIPVLINDD